MVLLRTKDQQTFSLNNFEGPLEFLLYLVRNDEIDIAHISLAAITDQFSGRLGSLLEEQQESGVDNGAEFIGTTASLMLWKSQMLLPKDKRGDDQEEIEDPRFEVIHQLIDYCRFRDAAKELSEFEERSNIYYPRGAPEVPTPERRLGIEHLSLDDIATLFQDILDRARDNTGTVDDEEWHVSGKIRALRTLITKHYAIPFTAIFQTSMCQGELIVTFLALLELMKEGDLFIALDPISSEATIYRQEEEANANV